VGRPEAKNHLEDPGVDGMIILKIIFKEWNRGSMGWFDGSGLGQVADFCECGNKPSLSIKGEGLTS
jgi:hypothetical protein